MNGRSVLLFFAQNELLKLLAKLWIDFFFPHPGPANTEKKGKQLIVYIPQRFIHTSQK